MHRSMSLVNNACTPITICLNTIIGQIFRLSHYKVSLSYLEIMYRSGTNFELENRGTFLASCPTKSGPGEKVSKILTNLNFCTWVNFLIQTCNFTGCRPLQSPTLMGIESSYFPIYESTLE